VTKNEIRVIASILATREAAIEELNVSLTEKLGARFAHRATAFDFAWELDHMLHDFNRAEFIATALPIYSSDSLKKWEVKS
jgi:hypothetical protein